MNFRKPREVQKDGKGTGVWHYTNDNQQAAYRIGYCADWREPVLRENGGWYFNEASMEEYRKRKPKYDACIGHDTYEEACACYKEYELDTSLRFREKTLEEADIHYKCTVKSCNEMTASMAMVGAYNNYHLCEKHLNRETVEKLFDVGESFGS